mmetsp:Transcript_8364/g.21322  ORF Transcript_8364/g.21322 Transcript_8364/m.21322 type:complete len:443 (-) Transcript_8364:75-1403(-)
MPGRKQQAPRGRETKQADSDDDSCSAFGSTSSDDNEPRDSLSSFGSGTSDETRTKCNSNPSSRVEWCRRSECGSDRNTSFASQNLNVPMPLPGMPMATSNSSSGDGFGESSDSEGTVPRKTRGARDVQEQRLQEGGHTGQKHRLDPNGPQFEAFLACTSPTSRSRRPAMQSSQEGIFEGLKKRFDGMESLSEGDATVRRDGADDIEYARVLNPAQFVQFLKAHGVPTEAYGKGKARRLKDLWTEFIIGECALEKVPKPHLQTFGQQCLLQRKVRMIAMEVEAVIDGVERLLLLRGETVGSGMMRKDLNTRVTKKLIDDEDLPSGIGRCLIQTLGLPEAMLGKQVVVKREEVSQELRDSVSYPGLTTIYTLNVVYLIVTDIFDSRLACIGLPEGRDFTTQQVVGALGGNRSRQWSWCERNEFEQATAAAKGQVYASMSTPRYW